MLRQRSLRPSYEYLIFEIIYFINVDDIPVLHLRKRNAFTYNLVSLHYPYFSPLIAKHE